MLDLDAVLEQQVAECFPGRRLELGARGAERRMDASVRRALAGRQIANLGL